VAKKRIPKKTPVHTPASASAVATGETAPAWPGSFPPIRRAALCGIAVLLWCALMLLLATADLFIAPKIALGWFLGLSNPADLGLNASSWDMAGLLGYGAIVVYAVWLHPMAGIIVLALLRPWLDGYTFPIDNHYFLWGVLLCFAAWAIKALLRGDRIRHALPAGMLAAFLVVALALTPASYNLGASYRLLMLWAGYLFLFVLAANAIDNRKVWLIVVGGISLTYFAQNLFSIFQYHYLLPYLRVLVDQRPEMLQNFFGTSELTPELANRLNRNRAFGTMLFPNAMAGFLVLGIPLALAGAWHSLRALGPALETGGPLRDQRERLQAAAVSVAVGLFVGATAFFLIQFPSLYTLGDLPWYADPIASAALALLAGGLVGALIFACAAQKGVTAATHVFLAAFMPLLAVSLLYGLALTYSRGAMVALLAALIAGGILLAFPRGWMRPALTRLLPPVAAGLVLAWALHIQPGALAQTEETAPPTPQVEPAPVMPTAPMVTQEGVNLSMQDMTDPATLRLRVDYWKVGARIFRHNWVTGVGLGNFQWAYPMHQRLGEGDVREAHNSFLQAYTETGILGGTLLLAFWIYVLLWGIRSILHQADARIRFWSLAVFTGLLAFLLHAAIDINFQHPSLMFFGMLFTGLMFATPSAFRRNGALADKTGDNPATATAGQGGTVPAGVVLIAASVAAALVLGVSLRSHLKEVALSRVAVVNVDATKDLKHREAVLNFFFESVNAWGRDRSPQKLNIPARSVLAIVHEPDQVAQMGPIYIPTPGRAQGWRQLQAGEVIPRDAVVVIERPWDAMEYVREHAVRWLQELGRIDSRFPHDPQLAAFIARQYATMAKELHAPRWQQHRKEATVQSLYWAEKAVERNPYHADLHALLAQSKTLRGWMETDPVQRARIHGEGLASLKRASELAPNIPHYLSNLSYTYRQIAQNYEDAGNPEDAARARAEADRFKAESDAIWEQRSALRLPY